MMLQLEYKPTDKSRKWHRSSLRMYPEGRSNMERTAEALKKQNNWFATRIVEAD